MSQAEFARYRGVSHQTVLRWQQRGNVVMDRWGELIDVEASDRMLDVDRPRFYRGGVASRRPGDTK